MKSKKTLLKRYRRKVKGTGEKPTSSTPETVQESQQSTTSTSSKVHDWDDSIPYEIKHDIQRAITETKKDNKEKAITFCRIKGKDKIHSSSYSYGEQMSTLVLPCNEKYGENTVKVGDLHTHPYGKIAMGITPSEADFTGTLHDAYSYKSRTISCVTNHGSKMVHCYQPKEIPNWSTVNKHYDALENTGKGNETDPYFRENIGKEFNHAWYDRKTFKRIPNPSADDILTDALGGAAQRYKSKDIVEIEKGTFCDLLQDYNLPENDDVGRRCRDFMQEEPEIKVAHKSQDENIRLDLPHLRIPKLRVPNIQPGTGIPDIKLPFVDYNPKITKDILP